MIKIIALFGSALFVLALAMFVYAPAARAHADISECTPPMSGTVETAPDKVVCKASQGMKAEGSSLQVFDASGVQVDRKDSAVDLNDPDRLTISVSLDTAMMKDGTYTVKWTTVSADDGDEANGEFKFTIGHEMQMNETPSATGTENPNVTHPNDDPSVGVALVNGKQVTLKIIAPTDDAALPVGDVKVEATVEGLTLGQDGFHLHFYLDDKLQAMGSGAQTIFTMNPEAGTHEIMVALADHDHGDLNNAHVHVTVGAAQAQTATAIVATAVATPTAISPIPAATPTSMAMETITPTVAPTATTTPTLPSTGAAENSVLIALAALFGAAALVVGLFAFTRARR